MPGMGRIKFNQVGSGCGPDVLPVEGYTMNGIGVLEGAVFLYDLRGAGSWRGDACVD